MNIEEIKQAITKLPPDELSQFRDWFKKYEGNATYDRQKDLEQLMKTLGGLRGSLKGKGVLKALMEERRKESLL